MSGTDRQPTKLDTDTAQEQASLSQADFADGQSSVSPTPECSHPSTGPRTEAGKAAASRNAVKHNLCSKRLTGSDLEELNAIRAKLDDEWQPSTETERLLLEQIALNQWRMERALSLELAAFDDTEINQTLLALAIRYRTTAERSFYKALTELQRLRKTIAADAVRQEKEEEQEREAAVTAALDRLCFAPIAGAPQFVSQNPSAIPNVRPQPDYDGLRAHLLSQISQPSEPAI